MSLRGFDKHKTFFQSPVLFLFRNRAFIKFLIAVATYSAIFLIVVAVVTPTRFDFEVGDIPDAPILATRDIEDERTTLERIEEAKASVLPVYTLQTDVQSEILSKVDLIFEEFIGLKNLAEQRAAEFEIAAAAEQSPEPGVTETPAEPSQNAAQGTTEPQPPSEPSEVEPPTAFDDEFLEQIRTQLSVPLTNEEILTVIETDQSILDELEVHMSYAISEALALRIKQENLFEAQSALREEIMRLPFSNEIRLLGATVGVTLIRPNMVFNAEATERERAEAAEGVGRVVYRRGQYIAPAGQPITEHQLNLMRELGLLDQVDIYLLIGIGIVLFIVYITVILYIVFYEKELAEQPLLLLMMSFITCLVLLLAYVSYTIHPYFVPFAMGGMLIAVLLQPRIALVINLALGIFIALMLNGQLNTAIVSITTGMIGIYLVNKLHNRNSLIWLGLSLGAAGLLTIWGVELILEGNLFTAFQSSVWGLGGGILAAVLTMGTLPIWEIIFGVITPIRLVELSNPNTNLLKRMLTEAPGTYHHSIIVANLAESAADAIGANGLLARVGAYYHDIGKLKRPHYFKENMISSENPHDRINPSTSTNIITSHTKEGLDLAKQYRIPRVLHDFITQHHGTSLVTYFFHKARTVNDKDADPDVFRHKGPKPKTPEVAIVMLADTVEAAVRALPEPTPVKVEGLIRKLLKDKLEDGQLDDCHLTLKNIDSIANAFTNVICGIFHERVEYPEVNLKESESKINDTGY